VKPDGPAITGQTGHQIGAALDFRRPAGEAIAGFEDCVFRKRIEKMFTLDQAVEAAKDDLKERLKSLKNVAGLKGFVSLFHRCDFCAG